MTNCRILSQEICFRASPYRKCSLLVNEWMKAHCISKLHRWIVQDYLTPCEVLVGNADCWTSMINGWPSYFNINPVPPITYWWIWMPLQEVTISIGTHTRSGSTMINTPWHVKIDTQELFFFMILPVGGTWSNWSSCLIEGKAWTLYRCTWNFWYLTTTMNALPRTMREPIVWGWGAIGYNMKL